MPGGTGSGFDTNLNTHKLVKNNLQETRGSMIIDIGGGSTEFILDHPEQPPIVRSIDIGVVRLCERLLHHDPPTNEEVQQARDWVERETTAAVARMGNYQTAIF